MIANGWTNMGGGISKSNKEFDTNGHSGSEIVWAMILLSDGKANRPEGVNASQYALDQAATARTLEGKGVRIYTIGLGTPGHGDEDIDEDLLKQIANDPTRYYHAPTADQLETIYLTIARDLLFQVKYDIIVIRLTLLGTE
jgi:Mg-chelatase subunit ChlD